MKNSSLIKILDCTLRDGGYLNDWNFSKSSIKSIITNLNDSKIDFIECGFLKERKNKENNTIFSSIKDLNFLPLPFQNYTLMINIGEYDVKNFTTCLNKNIKIRVAFKKYQQKEALEYIQVLKNLDWDVFANPMSTNTYSEKELFDLITELNLINPFGLTIVDTLGNMFEDDVIKIINFIDSKLNPNIALGFHSHNSLQLSFANTKAILKMNIKRLFIIDACLYGMGRGAGNLCTELITKYLNDTYHSNYNIQPLLKSIEDDLMPIYKKTPWGYSMPYYIGAINNCHPNYVKFLLQKGKTDKEIDLILSSFSEDKKLCFDENYAESLLK